MSAAAAEAIGVCAEPELAIKQLTSAHPFFVLGSDGIFEFMPSQTVVDMVCLQLLLCNLSCIVSNSIHKSSSLLHIPQNLDMQCYELC